MYEGGGCVYVHMCRHIGSGIHMCLCACIGESVCMCMRVYLCMCRHDYIT